MFAAIGVYLLGTTFWRYYSLGITENAVVNVIFGFSSFFVLRYQKLSYISPEGIVRETHTWISHHREVMKWGEIKFITIMHKHNEAMVCFERDILGWKVFFEDNQLDGLKKIFKKYIPDIDVNDIKPGV